MPPLIHPENQRKACIARRKELGLNQTEAAARIGWTQAQWSDWERGHRPNPRLGTILKVMKALETTNLTDIL